MAVVDWIGITGLWSDASKWSTLSVPTAADDVNIGVGDNVDLIDSAEAYTLDLFHDANLTSTANLTVGSVIRIGFGGTATSQLEVLGGTLSAPNIEVGPTSSGLLFVSRGTVTGSINVNKGSVIVGGTSPSGPGTIIGPIALSTATSSLIFRTDDDAAYGGNISGAGSILIDNRGRTITLSGDNSGHSGTTTIDGILQIGDGGTTGTLGTGAVINDGTLAFNHVSGQYNHVNAISGSGNLVVRGTAIEVLVGNNSYSGTTSVEGGTLAVGLFGTTGTLGTGDVTIASGAFLDLIRSDTQLVANAISGAGELRVYGDHTVILTGNNSYGNTTIFAGSTLQIGNGNTGGTLGTGAVTNDGTLVFNLGPGPSNHSNAIGGSGGLIVTGDGPQGLTGVSSYTGVTTVNSGNLGLYGEGSISNSAGIVLNGTGSFSIANISGASALVRDVFMTANGTEIALSGKTLIVTDADLYAGPGRFSGSNLSEAVVFNVASTSYTLAGATTGAVFSNWTDGVDSITINGNADANTLTGDELQATHINGGAGNDRIVIGNGGGNFDGGADSDTLVVGSTMTLTGTLAGLEAIELTGGATLTLSAAQFNAGFYNAIAQIGSAAVSGSGTLVFTIDASPGGAALSLTGLSFAGGSSVTVTIAGSSGIDVVKGAVAVANTITGGDGADQIRGGNQADAINGGTGNDKLFGWGGVDTLTGGTGSDQFRYFFATDSGTGAAADRITDFEIGIDKFNFTLIDADPVTGGDQAFAFLGTGTFTAAGTGQIRYQNSGADLLVQVDVDGNGTVDMEVVLQGLAGQALTGADFML